MTTLDSFAAALQYARKGIKTTVLDMEGLREKEEKQDKYAVRVSNATKARLNSTELIFGGVEGSIVCDVLRIDAVCDNLGKMHLRKEEGVMPIERMNARRDHGARDLTDGQMEEIDRAFRDYDCGILQHLEKYRRIGTFRLLHPSKRLLDHCNSYGGTDISFDGLMDSIIKIASRANGIPEERSPERYERNPTAIQWSNRAKEVNNKKQTNEKEIIEKLKGKLKKKMEINRAKEVNNKKQTNEKEIMEKFKEKLKKKMEEGGRKGERRQKKINRERSKKKRKRNLEGRGKGETR